MSASVEEPAEGTRYPRASTVGNPAFELRNPAFDLEEGGSGAQQAKTTMDGLAGVATAAGSMAAAQRAADDNVDASLAQYMAQREAKKAARGRKPVSDRLKKLRGGG